MELYGAFSKVSARDDGTIEVQGIASTPARDDADEIITATAMRAALDDYMKWGSIREMHGPSAAGTALEMSIGEDDATYLTAHIVDPIAIKKVKSGVYKGFSVGGKVEARDPADRRTITKIKLIEVSLVDRPCNPEAHLTMWKADMVSPQSEQDMSVNTPADPAVFAPPAAEVRSRATDLAKAAGKPAKRYVDYLYKAREAMREEHEAALAAVADAELDAASDTVEKADTVVVDDPAVTNPSHPSEKLATHLAAIEEALKTSAPVHAVEVASTPFAPIETLGKSAADMADKLDETGLVTKGLRGVADLASAIYRLVAVQADAKNEAKEEGDNSSVPAAIASGVATLLNALTAMAQEEVSELLADLNGPEGMEDAALDNFWCSDKAVDLIKAGFAAKMTVAPDGGTKVVDPELVEKVSGLEADKASLSKALEDTSARIEGIAASVDALTKAHAAEISALTSRLEAFGNEPLAPKTMGTDNVMVIEKAMDARGLSSGQSVDAEAIAKYLDSLPEQERGLELIKLSRRLPMSPPR